MPPMPQDQLEYTLLDVFTIPGAAPFTGNPLAIVHGSDALESGQLLAIAKQFNLSETTFPAPDVKTDKDGSKCDYHVRIFTVDEELPFAGHPSIGTAWLMRDQGVIAASAPYAIQSCAYGPVSIAFSSSLVWISSKPAFVHPAPDTSALHSAVSLAADAVVKSVYRASCGLPFTYVHVEKEEDLARCVPSREKVSAFNVGEGEGGKGVVVYTVVEEGDGHVRVHQRVFVNEVAEDPATGSASLGLGLVLHASSLLPRTRAGTYTIAQGAEVGHPSQIRGRVVTGKDGAVKECWVGGEVQKVGEGWIAVPGKSKSDA